ncbi:MAG TPA: hypothetical protein VFC44_04995 [Candidatus Saccharimonadales bacterium]|nr:hypothetical protein [Candidatus Saccharimonadales bacterium]
MPTPRHQSKPRQENGQNIGAKRFRPEFFCPHFFAFQPMLRGFRSGNVLNTCDVYDSALDKMFRQGMSVDVDADHYGIALHEHCVVICDVIGFAVGNADAKGLEWFRFLAPFKFDRAYHDRNLSFVV